MKKTQRDIEHTIDPIKTSEWEKMKIIESLERLMTEPKRAFWNTIQTDNEVTEIDITENFK